VTPVSSCLPLLKRGVVDLIDEKDLARKLERGPVTVKVGFDPSAPDIHLGHTVVLRKMRQFQDTGNRVVFVVGDFTAMIGDPSGKKATRPQLTREQVEENARTYTTQAFRVLDEKKTIIEFNGRWLTALGSAGLIRLASKITVARILERDDFQKRWRSQLPIALHELLYPLAQGYDSVALKADVELGGTDQLFNLLVGRDLMREEGLEPQVVITLPLLVGTDGVEKMSKSLGNAIGVQDPPADVYGKVMSIPDSLMWSYYELLTDVAPEELASRRRRVEKGEENPRDAKADLARTITTQFHGETQARRAEEDFRRAFSRGELPDVLEETTLAPEESSAARMLVASGLASSMREARRKIAEGALSVFEASQPRVVKDPEERFDTTRSTTLRLGRRFRRIDWRA
jgi:tyrosyl-tRNA synthetase